MTNKTSENPGTPKVKKVRRDLKAEVEKLASTPGGALIAKHYATFLDNRTEFKASRKRLLNGLDFLSGK